MVRINRIVFLFVLLAAIFHTDPVFALADILNIRHWAAPDHTRVVIDVSDDVSYSVDEADKKLIINLEETCVREDFPHELILKKRGIDNIMITSHPEGVSIELAIGENVTTKVFKQKKFRDKPDRIVIDIEFPEVEKQESKEREQEKVLTKNRIIVIDPGHGGDDPGAVGKHKTQEKKVVLEIGRKLRDILNKKEGYRAFLTRDGDYYVPFKKRLKIAREYGADLFVSIHADAFRQRGARGSSVYCLSLRGASSEAARLLARNENMADIIGGSPNGESSDESDPIILNMFQTNTINLSKTFGSCVMRHLNGVTKVKYRKVQEAPFIVLKLPEIPSILIETAYISNPGEENLLRSSGFQTEIAKAIAASVTEFLPAQTAQESSTVRIASKKKEESEEASPEWPKKDSVELPPSTKYTIKPGDTLDIIARKHDTKINVLLKLNGMKITDPLYSGRVLKVPVQEKEISDSKSEGDKASSAGEKTPPPTPALMTKAYKVKRGDTLDKVARNTNTTISVLLKLNSMKLEEPLYIGRTLRVPAGDTAGEKQGAVEAPRDTKSPPHASQQETTVYRVRKGDSIDKIAKRNNTTIGELLKLNKMKMQEPLYVGRKIKLPSAEANAGQAEKTASNQSKANVYRVKKGDTLDKIARRCNTSVSELRRLNRMKRADLLYVDQKLRLPPS
jgi:N-acetylmuramoyl-L-alanine amidase